MSLASALLLAEFAAARAGEGIAYLSHNGDGGPLLTHLRTPHLRIALHPEPRFFVSDGAVAPAEPLSPDMAAARFAPDGWLIVDGVAEEAEALIAAARRVRPGGADALRLRGAGGPPAGADRFYLTPGGSVEDRLFLKRRPSADIRRRALAFVSAEIDEFDALRSAIAEPGVIEDLRYCAAGVQVQFRPLSAALRPDKKQKTRALIDGRLGFDADGLCALSLPSLNACPGAIGLVVAGLPPEAPDPVVTALPGWSVSAARRGARWMLEATPEAAAPAVSTMVEIAAPEAPGAWVEEAWAVANRARGAWEDWDEAEAQLALEESW